VLTIRAVALLSAIKAQTTLTSHVAPGGRLYHRNPSTPINAHLTTTTAAARWTWHRIWPLCAATWPPSRKSSVFQRSTDLPKMLRDPSGQQRLDQHRQGGDTVVLITATLFELVSPVGQLMDISTVIASLSERYEGALTGRPHGTPCSAGKVKRASQYFRDQGIHSHDGFAASTFTATQSIMFPCWKTSLDPGRWSGRVAPGCRQRARVASTSLDL